MPLWTWITIGTLVGCAYLLIFSLFAVSVRADDETRRDARRFRLRG